MGTTYLLLGFMSSTALWLAGLGTIFALIYAFLIAGFSISGLMVYAAPFGAFSGFLLGWVIGFIMGIVTHVYFRTPTNERTYRFIMLLCAVIATLLGGFVFFTALIYGGRDVQPDNAFTLTITVTAAIAAAITSQRVAGWYLEHPKRTRDVPTT